jgi:hypothetical protein
MPKAIRFLSAKLKLFGLICNALNPYKIIHLLNKP